MKPPTLFIGSAFESLEIVEALENMLSGDILVEPWSRSFRPSFYTLEELTKKASAVDFAIFILGQEDKTESRGNISISPRDNVVYEAGLFAGYLGVSKVFLLISQGTKIPTDWKGLGYLEYDPEYNDAREAVRMAGITIRKEIADWKKSFASSIDQLITGSWWQFIINQDEGSVLSLMNIILSDKSIWKISGEAWTIEGKSIAKYWSRATAFDERDRKLFYYWEGEHPHDKSLKRFFGVGEINFEDLQSKIDKASGWYSETPLDRVDNTVRKSTKYFRAKDLDVKIMNGSDKPAIQILVNSRLNELRQL